VQATICSFAAKPGLIEDIIKAKNVTSAIYRPGRAGRSRPNLKASNRPIINHRVIFGAGRMRVGIARSLADSMSGGVFQYEIVVLKALGKLAKNYPEEFVYLCYHAGDLGVLAGAGALNTHNIPVMLVSKSARKLPPPEELLTRRPPTPPPFDPNIINFDYAAADALKSNGVDLLLLLSPNLPAFNYRLPFVVPIFDLNHRLQPEFPEVSAFGETNNREHYYINTCKFATLVLVDSEIGKADVLKFYGHLIKEDRIRVLPYYPPIENRVLPTEQEIARVRAKYNLPPRYFFYPAQFWPHKNHALILQAIKIIADEKHEVMPVIFCGAYWTYIMAQNFKDVMALALKLGIADRVRHLGSVPDEDMAALYTSSAGLVMPTFFGPTNIPPLEAWYFGSPVIMSDIRGAREHNGDAGLLVDPRSPRAMADAMYCLWRDDALCAELVARGRRRLASYSWTAFVNSLGAIIREACDLVRTGRTPRYPAMTPPPVQKMQRT
jgi:glycosyltransferase involved in cell wall biosynthesis